MLDKMESMLIKGKIKAKNFVESKLEGANHTVEVIAMVVIILAIVLIFYNVLMPKATTAINHIGSEVDTISKW